MQTSNILSNSSPLFKSDSHKLKISCNSKNSGKANSDILPMNQSLLRGPVELSLFVTFTPFQCKTCRPNTGPRVTASYSLHYKGLYNSEYQTVGGRMSVFPLRRSRPRLGLGLVFCVLWTDVIYGPPYRDLTTGTCWEAPQKKTTCNIWGLL